MYITISKRGVKLIYNKGRKLLHLDRLMILALCLYVIISTISMLCSSKTLEVQAASLNYAVPPKHQVITVAQAELKKEEHKVQVSNTETNNILNYRLTHYYHGDSTDSGTTTSSGKSIKDFQVNENGWYTYQGKLVIATAHKALLKWDKYSNSTQRLFNLYDELTLDINGKQYKAIVLDVCGAAMKEPRIDLFVKDSKSGIDAQIKVII